MTTTTIFEVAEMLSPAGRLEVYKAIGNRALVKTLGLILSSIKEKVRNNILRDTVSFDELRDSPSIDDIVEGETVESDFGIDKPAPYLHQAETHHAIYQECVSQTQSGTKFDRPMDAVMMLGFLASPKETKVTKEHLDMIADLTDMPVDTLMAIIASDKKAEAAAWVNNAKEVIYIHRSLPATQESDVWNVLSDDEKEMYTDKAVKALPKAQLRLVSGALKFGNMDALTTAALLKKDIATVKELLA